MASLYIVGTGPGAVCHLTDAARQAIAASDVIVGYDSYVELVRTLLTGKQVISTGMMQEARNILLAYRPADTPAGIVRNACREGEAVVVTTLGGLLDHEIDMTSIVLIGNASSFIDAAGRIVTPRGYAAKYAPAAVATESVTE